MQLVACASCTLHKVACPYSVDTRWDGPYEGLACDASKVDINVSVPMEFRKLVGGLRCIRRRLGIWRWGICISMRG
jgi:hypothetical protein